MSEDYDYHDGRRTMAAEIMLILAAGAGKSDLLHDVASRVRHVWDPEQYPLAPLPRGILDAINEYDDALHTAAEVPVEEPPSEPEERHGFGSRSIIVPSEPIAAVEGEDAAHGLHPGDGDPENAAVEGADAVDESLGDA